jgi:glycosyltransferase involved in cell wall biosynthesis
MLLGTDCAYKKRDTTGMSSYQLTVIVPALNEENTIAQVIDRLLALPVTTQVIVVNDGSTDNTAQILAGYGNKITTIHTGKPGGKGNAIRAAIPKIEGQVVVIQDADLEYAPEEIPALVHPILEGRESVVFGSRFANGLPAAMALPNKIVNVLLALAVRVLYGTKITDEATCYKAFRSDIVKAMELECKRFEFCPETVAKSIRLGCRIAEVPITYVPRSKQEGKKIRWTDAPEAFWTLAKYRFWKSRSVVKPEPAARASDPISLR